MTKKATAHQAQLFARYLLKRPATTQALELYEQAIDQTAPIDQADRKLLSFIEKYPRSLGFIDAGLPFLKPYSEVRRRLYLMLAILEASPEYVDSFLPRKRRTVYGLYVAYSGARAVLKAVLGVLAIKVIAR